ncbi:succinate dehydrogenase / fumarate reductase flavoprotein subunit [Cupriavidus sp. OV038]|uniref:FAD-binding protein n=1 Tax=unclassified Cupriavidus TaxID=2640874 RepID=UPI0008DFB670|nr:MULTISPECIES: FAD-binding protein [unclassified Cupriavidus]SFC55963.1 succinate dehydrogenase / fumarate reductase flavoprotein subunit [Cupriavidus sp. OV038]SFP46473.1 succinate dehydrogenase / fumarate reductase flavoprotein subunit [Cupriavidus sp. OV096]
MPAGIPFEDARKRYRPGAVPTVRSDDTSVDELLKGYHPDHGLNARVALSIGVNQGDPCQPDLARYLQANALIDDIDIAGAQVISTDVLIVGGGGGGCAAALIAAKQGAQVILATKLRLGDSNTVMAEGGIQAAVGEDDSPQLHFEDTLRAGHFCGEPELVAQMVMDGPDVIRWLIQLGVMFDLEEGRPMGGNLLRKKPGGASAARILSYRDYTGLEMMRVLREAVDLDPAVEVWNRCPAVELLSDERGRCAGAVIYNLESRTYVLVRARAVILATGGAGRLHLNAFPTSNHYGATADGLVLAYRIGAHLRELDSFQYHPTGIAYPAHLAGGLISEAARSAGAKLINGEGERFVDELKPRDVVASAILRECAQGRGIDRDGQTGVFLDTPTLEMENPGILAKRLVTLRHLARKCGHDAALEPFLVYPTLHYQNGGVAIDKDGATSVPGLFCVGEVTGGIHGRNRLMGNALLDILSMGRRAGAKAAESGAGAMAGRAGIGHVHAWQRQLTLAGLPLHVKAPQLFPGYAHFDLRVDAALRRGKWGGAGGGVR